MVLLRFAPSPTGSLHLGGLRTALYNYLYAKKFGGKWILRIEDTDATRAVPGAVDGIREALEWAGLEYDYGPGRNGPHSPYFQSERLDLYHSYAHKLLESGHAYRCFCSSDKLASTRERLARSGSNTTYDKTCLTLTDEEVTRRVRAGEKSIIRLNDGRLPPSSNTVDLVFGALKDAHASLPTDPVLLKSDLFPTYHLASVVDDYEMGITHVIRGEEWLPSLPLHVDLYNCLSIPQPKFAHLPLLLNPDGSKMSKRKGDVRVLDYMRRGWDRDAVLNWLALVGWGVHHESSPSSSLEVVQDNKHAPDSTTMMSMAEIIRDFDLSSITHRRTILDPAKLEYLNKHHIMRSMQTDEGLTALAERAHGVIKECFPHSQYTTVQYIKGVILALQGRITNIFDLPSLASFFFEEPDLSTDEAQEMARLAPVDHYVQVVHELSLLLQEWEGPWTQAAISNILHLEIERLNYTQKKYMTILRHALSGFKTGPSVADITHVIGCERTMARLKMAENAMQENNKTS